MREVAARYVSFPSPTGWSGRRNLNPISPRHRRDFTMLNYEPVYLRISKNIRPFICLPISTTEHLRVSDISSITSGVGSTDTQ